MMPSGNGPFPNKKKKKKWGRGQISRDTCSTGNHLLEESKSHKTVSASGISCWIQKAGEGGGGQWLEASLVVPFLFHTQSNTHLKHAAAISQNLSQPLAFSCVWRSFVAGLVCISRTGGIKWHCERLWAQKFSCSGTTHPFPVHRTRRSL